MWLTHHCIATRVSRFAEGRQTVKLIIRMQHRHPYHSDCDTSGYMTLWAHWWLYDKGTCEVWWETVRGFVVNVLWSCLKFLKLMLQPCRRILRSLLQIPPCFHRVNWLEKYQNYTVHSAAVVVWSMRLRVTYNMRFGFIVPFFYRASIRWLCCSH